MISVIIPTYNRSHTILRSVNSVLNQTYKDIEILIIDDGSTDNTQELIKQIKDSRIRYICQQANSGVAIARNTGVNLALGEWIAFQDSDDEWFPEKLEKQISYASKHPEYNLIYCSFRNHNSDGSNFQFPHTPYRHKMEGNLYTSLLEYNTIDAPTIFVKRKEFLSVGGFDSTYSSLEDWEFVIRFSKNNLIGFTPDILVNSYLLQEGISSNIAAYYDSRCRILAEYKEDIINLGLFNSIAMDILTRAANSGIQEQVKKIMMIYLQTLPGKII